MNFSILKVRFLLAAIGCIAIWTANYFIKYRRGIPFSSEAMTFELLVPFMCLAWVALGELRRLGKTEIVRNTQVLAVIVLAMSVFSGPGMNGWVLNLAISAVLVYVFAMTSWTRRGNSLSQKN
jgi:hypothetical protein